MKKSQTFRRILFFIFFFFCSKTFLQAQFGLEIIKSNSDTLKSQQHFIEIKSLQNELFDTATYIGSEKVEIKYRFFKPNKINTKKYPLVIVFHGSGQIGNDNISQLGILPKLFAYEKIQKKYPAFVLAPQFASRSSDYSLDSSRNILASKPRPFLNSTVELIDSLVNHLNIDKKRIYLVGYSMGASTTINALSARPDFFAAGISIAGIPEFDNIDKLREIPIWLIHGMEDEVNSISSDEKFYEELKRFNKIRFWKLEATNHLNIFQLPIIGEALPKWLFKQKRKF